MERLRRILLVAGIVTTVWAGLYADLSPLVTLKPTDKAPRHDEEIVPVDAPAWTPFLAMARDAAFGRGPDAWRAGPEQDYTTIARRLFFRPDESPLDLVSSRLTRPYESLHLVHDGQSYELTRVAPVDDDFHFGTGYSSLTPPSRFFRPYRFLVPYLIAATLALYVFLPWPKREPGDLVHQRFRVVLGDVVGVILFGLFFTLPFLVIGGSVQLFTVGWPLIPFFWLPAAIGLAAFPFAAWLSAYAVRLTPTSIQVRSFDHFDTFPFSEMLSFGPALRRNPRWLRTLAFLALLTGKSAGRSAALAASSESQGLAIHLRSSHTLFFWICSPLGTPTIPHADRLPAALRGAKIPELSSLSLFTRHGRGHLVPTAQVQREEPA